jgi:hypothetical protein
VVEYLPAEIPGHGGNITVTASPMRSRLPTFCVTICKPGLERSVCTEDLAKGHILEVEWGPVGNGCADLRSQWRA